MLTSSLLCSISLVLLAIHAAGSSLSMTLQEQHCLAQQSEGSCSQDHRLTQTDSRSVQQTRFVMAVLPDDHRGSGR